jgi:hypothetical protein
VQREHHRAVHPGQQRHQRPQPRGIVHVARPVRRGQQILAPAHAQPVEHGSIGPRREQLEHVDHHVTHDDHVAEHALVAQCPGRVRRGAEQQRRGMIGQHAVELLGHRPVVGAHPRLDVGDRDAGLGSGQRAGQRRVRVAVDQHDVRRLGREQRLERRQHPRRLRGVRAATGVQAVLRPRQPELVEEHPRERVVVVLPRVHQHLLGRRAQPLRDRRRLDELRAVADDG